MARDLGIDVAQLTRRHARVVAEGTQQFCELRWETGCLLVSERMDREELCAQSPSCVLQFQLLLEDPLEVYSILLHIQDINDNRLKTVRLSWSFWNQRPQEDVSRWKALMILTPHLILFSTTASVRVNILLWK